MSVQYEQLSALEQLLDKQPEYIKEIIMNMIKPHCKCIEIGTKHIYMCNISNETLHGIEYFIGRRRDFLFIAAIFMTILVSGGIAFIINRTISRQYEIINEEKS